jgi:hypothetical protein
MTDLKSSLQVVLQDAGYQTWLVSLDDLEAIGFEDDGAMGFAYVFEDVATMLTRWRELETRLLTRHAPSLQKAGEKTWNIYSVFLCTELATPDQLREIRWIEEDLERTRKIAGCGLTSTSDVVTALLPLLPLQYQPLLDSEDFDLTQRLLKRIANIAPAATDAALDKEILPSEVVRLLGAEI